MTAKLSPVIESAPDAFAREGAWQWVRRGGRAPIAVEPLKPPRRKSAVYLLRDALPAGDVVAKRAARETLSIERHAYRVLDRLPVENVRCLGYANDRDEGYGWLFTAHSAGASFSRADATHRTTAAHWLASVHVAAAPFARQVDLPSRDAAYYRSVVDAARAEISRHRENPALTPDDHAVLDAITARCCSMMARWREVERICDCLPTTLVHGGFGSKNVRIVERPHGGASAVAFDWEAAGWGTPAADISGVDIDAYSAAVATEWQVDPRALHRLAALGTVFWALSAIPGESRSLASAWPHRVMSKMRAYLRRMDDAAEQLDGAVW